MSAFYQMTPDVLRDWQAQGDYVEFTWEHLAIMVGIFLLTWLIAGYDGKHR